MKTQTLHRFQTGLLLLGMIVSICFAAVYPQVAHASVLPGTTCTELAGVRTCDLWAATGTITLPGGASFTIWGYAGDSLSPAGLPGPTLIATAGETLEINLHNGLSEATSLSVRGLFGASDRSGVAAGGTKTYTYNGLQPGTYLYEAGPTANGERQVALGMYGVLIVRPAGAPLEAYGPASAFDDETVLVMSEIDPALNTAPASFDLREFSPKYFLFNGKAYPDTLPIDTNAGRKVLLRLVNAGLENHSVGVLGLRYTVLSIDGKPLAQPHSAVAETLSAGQTADVLVTMPAVIPPDMKYAVYDSNLHLINNGQAFGGMLTFLAIPAGPTAGDITGPAASGLSLAPNPTDGLSLVTFNVTVSDSASGGNNIMAAEYFVDTQGANGAGTAMTPSDAAFDSPTESAAAAIDPTGLLSGNHTVYVHGQDSLGNWGAFNFIVMSIDQAGPSTTSLQASYNGAGDVALSGSANDSATGNSSIQAAEFFIDASGANGAGTPMTVNQTAPIASINAAIAAFNISGLLDGYHPVYIHSQDAFGNWGAFTSVQMSVDRTGPAPSAIILAPNPNNGALAYSPSFQSVRLDAAFSEPGGGPVTSTVANAEFFIDTVGANGTGVLMTPGDGLFNGVTESAYTYIPLVTVNSLADGVHVVSIHGKDVAGNWGPFATINLVIDKGLPVVSGLTLTPPAATNTAVAINATADDTATGNNNIVAGEYFIDAVGAAGTGAAMTVGAASPSTTISATIPVPAISALTTGSHTVYVRAKDSAGNWSATVNATLTKGASVAANALYFSTFGNSNPPGVAGAADDADIYNYDGTSFSRVFDATAAGVPGGANVDGYERVDATHFYMSFTGNVTLPGAGTVQDEDVVFYNAGTWSLFFDGSVNGVGGNFDLDAISIVGGTLYFSTDTNLLPPGAGGAADDADIYVWNGGSSYTRVFDASAVGIAGGADVDGFDRVDATHFYLSFQENTALPGFGTVQDEDVAYNNAGVWSVYFDGTALGLTAGNHDVDAFDLP